VEFSGGRKKRPAFSVGAVAKAIVHGTLDEASKKRATLLVYDFKFLSHRLTRIKEANTYFEFQAKKGSTSLGPTVEQVAPYSKHVLMRTTETVTTTIGGDGGIEAGSILTANAGIHGERSVNKTVTHSAKVVGDNPADDWGNRCVAQWSLSENDSQKSGIVSLFRACILLTRDNDEEFYLHPTIQVTPDTLTRLKAPLSGFRPRDDPIKMVPTTAPYNKLGGNVAISTSNLSAGLADLWDCTFHSSFENAIKASKPNVTAGGGVQQVTIVKEAKEALS